MVVKEGEGSAKVDVEAADLATRPKTFTEYLLTIPDSEKRMQIMKRRDWLLMHMGILDGKHHVPTLDELGTTMDELVQLYLLDPDRAKQLSKIKAS